MVPGTWRIRSPTTWTMGAWTASIRPATRTLCAGFMSAQDTTCLAGARHSANRAKADSEQVLHPQLNLPRRRHGRRVASQVAARAGSGERERVDVPVPIRAAEHRIAREARLQIRPLVHREARGVQISGAIEAETDGERLAGLEGGHVV